MKATKEEIQYKLKDLIMAVLEYSLNAPEPKDRSEASKLYAKLSEARDEWLPDEQE